MASSDHGQGGNHEPHRTTGQAQDRTNARPRMETIPTDIRRYLLSFLDLKQLSALVHASPLYHAQYREDRRVHLTESVKHFPEDALVVRLFQSQKRDLERDVPDFLRSHSGVRARDHLSSQGKLDLDAAVDMAHFYFNVVRPLADTYASWALENLAQETGRGDAISMHGRKLTSAEKMRLTRAIYRFQLLCDIVTPHDTFLRSERRTNAEAFFDSLHPWEVEETLAFFEFARARYAKLVEDVRWDLHPNNPKFEDQNRPPTPDGAVDLENEMFTGWYWEGLTLHGLDLLHTALFKVRDHDHLVSLVRDNIVSSNIPLDAEEGPLGDLRQETRYEQTPTEQDKLQEAQTPMPFQGDGKPDAPPLAWTSLWRESYSSLYGYFIPAGMRSWGYVFWDASTLQSTGALELLERLKEDFLDPRDDMY